MRVLIYFSPTSPLDVYEGIRLRKSLKNALEDAGVLWVNDKSDTPNLIHFLSPEDEMKATAAKEAGYPVVVSALYAENDPSARFLDYQDGGGFTLKAKARRMFKAADLVLVPSLWAKNVLLDADVSSRIEIVPSGVNLKRFQDPSPLLQEAFFHYFMIAPDRPYAIVCGDYEDTAALDALETLASLRPELSFYFFGLSSRPRKTAGTAKKLNESGPENVHFSDVSGDDVYRSALLSASFYLSLSFRHPDAITPLEAMAAKVQFFSLGPTFEGDPNASSKLGYHFTDLSLLSESLAKYRQGRLKPTIIEGYKAARASSIKKVGGTIRSLYEDLLKEEVDHD